MVGLPEDERIRPKGLENDASARAPNLSSECVTLNFDILTPIIDCFMPLPS